MSALEVEAGDVVFVGDSIRDLQAAAGAGCHAALVLTGTAVIGLGLAGAPVWQLLGSNA